MSSFRGAYDSIPVDDKGRIILPRKIRGSLPQETNDSCVLAAWLENCLAVFDTHTWNELTSKIQSGASVSDANTRNLLRFLHSNSDDVKIDNQGRISINKKLLGFAGITDRVTVIGVGDHAEIWSPERYEQHMAGIDVARVAELTDLF